MIPASHTARMIPSTPPVGHPHSQHWQSHSASNNSGWAGPNPNGYSQFNVPQQSFYGSESHAIPAFPIARMRTPQGHAQRPHWQEHSTSIHSGWAESSHDSYGHTNVPQQSSHGSKSQAIHAFPTARMGVPMGQPQRQPVSQGQIIPLPSSLAAPSFNGVGHYHVHPQGHLGSNIQPFPASMAGMSDLSEQPQRHQHTQEQSINSNSGWAAPSLNHYDHASEPQQVSWHPGHLEMPASAASMPRRVSLVRHPQYQHQGQQQSTNVSFGSSIPSYPQDSRFGADPRGSRGSRNTLESQRAHRQSVPRPVDNGFTRRAPGYSVEPANTFDYDVWEHPCQECHDGTCEVHFRD
jgi:hypothetical protein